MGRNIRCRNRKDEAELIFGFVQGETKREAFVGDEMALMDLLSSDTSSDTPSRGLGKVYVWT